MTGPGIVLNLVSELIHRIAYSVRITFRGAVRKIVGTRQTNGRQRSIVAVLVPVGPDGPTTGDIEHRESGVTGPGGAANDGETAVVAAAVCFGRADEGLHVVCLLGRPTRRSIIVTRLSFYQPAWSQAMRYDKNIVASVLQILHGIIQESGKDPTAGEVALMYQYHSRSFAARWHRSWRIHTPFEDGIIVRRLKGRWNRLDWRVRIRRVGARRTRRSRARRIFVQRASRGRAGSRSALGSRRCRHSCGEEHEKKTAERYETAKPRAPDSPPEATAITRRDFLRF